MSLLTIRAGHEQLITPKNAQLDVCRSGPGVSGLQIEHQRVGVVTRNGHPVDQSVETNGSIAKGWAIAQQYTHPGATEASIR